MKPDNEDKWKIIADCLITYLLAFLTIIALCEYKIVEGFTMACVLAIYMIYKERKRN